MDDRQFEGVLAGLLKADFAAGTEGFRSELLARCLAELRTNPDADEGADALDGPVELEDANLEFLAAAGDLTCLGEGVLFADDGDTGR